MRYLVEHDTGLLVIEELQLTLIFNLIFDDLQGAIKLFCV